MPKTPINRAIRFFDRAFRKIYGFPVISHAIARQFHRLFYYSKGTWKTTFWQGTSIRKCPFDLWVYQEMIYELKPDRIIECGTYKGGSALYLASLCDLAGNGKIISIDIEEHENRPTHERITYLLGSSTSEEIVNKVRGFINGAERVMVILDSAHSMQHVLNELRIYEKFVTPGSYIIVEDTNLNGHPVRPRYDPGPMKAVKIFLRENKAFTIDKKREKYFVSFNPNGYLKRIE